MVAVFKPILLPKNYGHQQIAAFKSAIDEGSKDSAKEMQQLFDKTTETWSRETKPFSYIYYTAWPVKATKAKLEMGVQYKDVYANAPIWQWIDEGTRPHIIKAKYAKTLAFPSIFRAKTKVNTVASYKGAHGGKTVFRQQVRHPGTRARRFTAAIQKKASPWIQKRMLRAAEEGSRRADKTQK